MRRAFRGAHSGAPIQGCDRHLVRVVKGAEGILVLAEVGVLQAVRLREVGAEEVEKVPVGLLGHKDEACLEGVTFPKGKVWARRGGLKGEDWAGWVRDKAFGRDGSDWN